MVRLVYYAGYGTRGMPLAFEREAWRRYFADIVNFFVLPALEVQGEVANRRQDAQSALSRGALRVVENAVDLELITEEDKDSEFEGAVGLEKAERVGVERGLQGLEESYRAKKRKVSKTIAEAFGLVESCYCLEALQIIWMEVTRMPGTYASQRQSFLTCSRGLKRRVRK